MPHHKTKRSQTSQTATASTPQGEFKRHLEDLALENAEAYRNWCREQGFSANLNKTWHERRQEVQAALRIAADARAQSVFRQHWRALGFAVESDYLAWCRRHTYPATLNKTLKQLQLEQAQRDEERARQALTHSRRQERRPKDAIQHLYHHPDEAAQLTTPYLQKIGELFASKDRKAVREALLRLLLHAQQHARLFGLEPVISDLGHNPGNMFLDGLHALARQQARWQRPLEAWKPDTRNAHRQFGALARHLLTEYPVPAFMDRAWFEGETPASRRHQGWFLHIGSGQNIRTAEVPFPLTKMAAHYFLLAPATGPHACSIEGALRWGQIRALSGSGALARAVNATRLGSNLAALPDHEFWQSVIHFFVNNPMLDMVWVGPMVDFIYDRKFVWREEIGPDGAIVVREPAEPGFAMKGRTAIALQRRVEEWHRHLAKETRKPFVQWPPSGIGGYTTLAPDPNTGQTVRWKIVELVDSAALKAEGKTMHHCVATYARSCARGQVSVWSMQTENLASDIQRSVMTIAINNATRTVTQAKGRCNKGPADKRAGERLHYASEILKQWAAQERLTVPSHV